MIFTFEMDNDGHSIGSIVMTPKGRGEIISKNLNRDKAYEVLLTTGVTERFRHEDIKLERR